MRILRRAIHVIAAGAVAITTLGPVAGAAAAQGASTPPGPQGQSSPQGQCALPGEFVLRLANQLGVTETTLRSAISRACEEMMRANQGPNQGSGSGMQPSMGGPMGPSSGMGQGMPQGSMPGMMGPGMGMGQGMPQGSQPGMMGPSMGMGHGMPQGSQPGVMGPSGGPDMLAIVTDVLGIDSNSLKEEMQQGKTLGQIADAQGIDRQLLIDRMEQTMLDFMRERMQEEIRRMLDRAMGPPPGQFRGR